MDIGRYRATLQALTEARQSAATSLLCGHVDGAGLEQWQWPVQLLDSIERSARRAFRETVLINSPRMVRR